MQLTTSSLSTRLNANWLKVVGLLYESCAVLLVHTRRAARIASGMPRCRNCSTARRTDGRPQELKTQIDEKGWDSLTKEEQGNAYHEFLLRIKPDDYVVFVNVPEWGKCTLARVTTPYFFQIR